MTHYACKYGVSFFVQCNLAWQKEWKVGVIFRKDCDDMLKKLAFALCLSVALLCLLGFAWELRFGTASHAMDYAYACAFVTFAALLNKGD